MKKLILKKIIFALAVLLCFAACSPENRNPAHKQAEGLNVYTSFYCIYDLTKKVAGDKAEVTNLIPAGTEPHDWEPTPGDMAALSKCDVLFCNGLDMEGWLDSVRASADVNAVVLSDNITDLPARDDPHIWLDPRLAKQLAQGICDTLSQLDAKNADYYSTNLDTLSARLDELDEAYRTELEPYKGGRIVVSHKAYSYLCAAYGLEQTAVDGLFADSEPSPQQMKQIIDTINAEGITTVFYEELLSKKIVEAIAAETSAQLLPLNPIEGLEQEEIDSGNDYFSIMEENLENLKTALHNNIKLSSG